MCLSVPARVLEIEDSSWATVDVGGARKRIAIDLVEDVAVGDYVLVHVGFALQKIDELEAQEVLELFRQMVEDEVRR
jgi:hydrogenase expression/formation protein HypC